MRYNLWKALIKLSSRDTFAAICHLENGFEPNHHGQIRMHHDSSTFDGSNRITASTTPFIFAMIPKVVSPFTLLIPIVIIK